MAVAQSKTDLMDFDGTMDANTLRAHAIDSERDIRRAAIDGYNAKGEFDKAGDFLADSSEFFTGSEQRAIRNQIKSAKNGAVNEVTALSKDHFASIQTTGVGIPGLRDKAQALMKPNDFKKFVRTEDIARDSHSFTSETAFATPDEMVRRLEALRPKSGSEGFADRQRKFEAANSAARQIMTQRAKDPAAYARSRPDINKAFQQAQDGDLPLPVATTMLLKAQEEMGIPARNRQVLPKAQAEAIVGEWDASPASERSERMAQMQQQYGEHFPAVFKDLVGEGLSGETQVLASVLGDPNVTRKLAEAIELGSTELKKGSDSAAVTDLRNNIVGAFQPFSARVAVGGASADRLQQTNNLVQAAENLALLYMREGANANDGATRAYNDIIGKNYDLDAIPTAYIPIGIEGVAISPAAVETTAKATKTRGIIEDFDPEPLGSQGLLDADAHREETIKRAVDSGFWVTSPAGTGSILMVPIGDGGALPLLDRNDEMLEVDFIDATRFPRKAPKVETGVEGTVRSRGAADRQRRQTDLDAAAKRRAR